MRQAGRYLPEYRQTRTRAGDFLNLCKTPELACEVTLQPLARFELDAAIVFSDILTIPDAMGLGLSLNEGIGPRFERPVSTVAEIEKLHVPDPESELGYVLDTVRMVKRALADRIPLIGFAGSPWTLATYMIEGGSSRDFALTKALLYAGHGFRYLGGYSSARRLPVVFASLHHTCTAAARCGYTNHCFYQGRWSLVGGYPR